MSTDRDEFVKKYKIGLMARIMGLVGYEKEIEHIILVNTDRFALALERVRDNKIKLGRDFKDHRTDVEYVYDVIDGWLVEELVFLWFQKYVISRWPQVTIEFAGADKDRVFQTENAVIITTEPDFIFKIAGSSLTQRVEVQYAGWARASYDMKEPKVQRGKREPGTSLIMWFVLFDTPGLFFFVDPVKDLFESDRIRHEKWDKPVYRLPDSRVLKYHRMCEGLPISTILAERLALGV